MTGNPFKVSSPEEMSAEDVTTLFVPVAEGLELDEGGHVFVHGHRGCGKSMLLRSMAPDCRTIIEKVPLEKLSYLGIYATVKATGLDVAEYERLENQYVGLILAEHSLVAFLGSKVFESLRDQCSDLIHSDCLEELKQFADAAVLKRLTRAGSNADRATEQVKNATSISEVFRATSAALDSAYSECADYVRRRAFSEYQPYQGPLLTYHEFLFPLLCEMTKELSFMPRNRPVYFLIDDADNLNSLQTRVLNTWVSFRTTNRVSFKITTQLAYKTFLTSSRLRIESPHDFRELHVSSIHTGSPQSGHYPKWVEKIVKKRLEQCGITTDPKKFFPVDETQEKAIKEIGKKIKEDWAENSGGFRANDDVYRYARPEYIKSLGGTSKQQSNYRYAGFSQLVHISSGIIRFFLDNATQMYARQQISHDTAESDDCDACIVSIDPVIQNDVVRDAADEFMMGDLDQLEQEVLSTSSVDANDFGRLRNLVRGLGAIFYEVLVSDRSERRIFSIALSDDPPEEVMRVIRLGVRHGYFYHAAIGTKGGRWRTHRYVMTRRLAPHFKLDPTGFSGYLFVTTELLQLALANPNQAIVAFREKRLGVVVEQRQLSLEF